MATRTFPVAGCLFLLAALLSEPAHAVRLGSLSVTPAQLTPAFQGGRFSYTATVDNNVTQVQVTAVPTGYGSSLTVNGLATPSGTPSAPIALMPGQNTIRVASTGRPYWFSRITTDIYTIVITRAGNNAPPTVDSIAASSSTASFGTAITFTGSASDPDQGDLSASIAWVSDREGSLGSGASVTRTLTNLGTHTITATVTDSAGASASRTLAVTITNSAPMIEDLSVSAAEVERGTPVTMAAAAFDEEEGDVSGLIRWSSSRDGNLGTGASLTRTLTVGSHTLTATVTDGAGASASSSIAVSVTESSGGTRRPNILFIQADDMGSEASILYPELSGNSGQVPTPHLQSLAAQGIVFNNAWAHPVCSPTRAALISGKYGHRTGVTNVGQTLPPATNTSIFQYVAGSSPESYGIGVFGKWHIGSNVQHVRDTGVPTFRGFIGGGISNYFNWNHYNINGNLTNTTTYSTTALTNFAIDFIQDHRANSSDPWFVYLPYNAPHGTGASTGFQVPPANLHSVDVGGLAPGTIRDTVPVYKAMIQAMDTEIGRLLDAIGPVGTPERDNTIIIFMGDNGTPAAVKDPGARVRGSKSAIFEGGIRVPLLISGAGVTRNGVRDDALVVDTDMYATIAALSGIPVSQIENSYSLVPLLTSDGATSGRAYSFSEMCTSQAFYAIRDQRYKLSYSAGVWALYDLVADPMESTNRFNDATLAAKRTELQAQLTSLRQGAQFGCFR